VNNFAQNPLAFDCNASSVVVRIVARFALRYSGVLRSLELKVEPSEPEAGRPVFSGRPFF